LFSIPRSFHSYFYPYIIVLTGVIVDLDFARRSNVLCKWEGEDDEVWMKASDIWVLDSVIEVNNDPLNRYIGTIKLPSIKKPPNFASLITFPEVTMDVTKWVAYDFLSPDSVSESAVNFFEVTKVGALSGMLGNAFFEILKKNSFNSTTLGRFSKAGIEGAALFAAYEESISYINSQKEIRQALGDKLPFIPYDDE